MRFDLRLPLKKLFCRVNAFRLFKFVLVVNAFLFVYAILYSNVNKSETARPSSATEPVLSYDFAYNYSYYPHFNSMEMMIDDSRTSPSTTSRPRASPPASNVNSKILLVFGNVRTNLTRSIIELVSGLRFNYRLESINPEQKLTRRFQLQFKNRGYYSLIIVESLQLIDAIGERNRAALKDYCKKYQVGVIYLASANSTLRQATLLNGRTRLRIDSAEVEASECRLASPSSSFYELLKFRSEGFSKPATRSLIHFLEIVSTDSICYEPIVACGRRFGLLKTSDLCPSTVRQVLIGITEPDEIQIFSLLLAESIRFASYERLRADHERYFQVDIDDIFVGPLNRRMKPRDVDALISFQNALNAHFGESSYAFRFNLGFSGYYFRSGTPEENRGDEMLIERRAHFNWFEHGWFHFQPHQLNASHLREHMLFNFHFAMEYGLPVDSFYAVSPHHSGIYPVYDPLFKYWRDVWLIKATSTEGYPHLRPFYMRKGFVHDDIMVVPRQTCGIYTHTVFLNSYPNGIGSLVDMITGGEIFKTVLYNRVLIFMTHMTNYASDRMAHFLFERLFEFARKWTNLSFLSLPPVELAKKYFEIYPEDREPLWTNACTDRRHLAIWSKNYTKYCDRLPKLIILGPQKTGTTALYAFLKLHPLLRSNKDTPEEHEETQFFTDNYYYRGPEWYMSLFKRPENKSIILFEKSANYFSEPRAPLRVKSLIGDAKLVIITIDPVKRAYSWYQHMRFHNNSAAVKYSFYDVLTAENITTSAVNEKDRDQLLKLRSRCLEPGNYYKHFKSWLNNFPANQILLLDGDQLRKSPFTCMNQIQSFLGLELMVDYRRLLKYDSKKGFYCMRLGSGIEANQTTTTMATKCLGLSKGRHYEDMDSRSELLLKRHYNSSNLKFYKLLRKKRFPIPVWLKESVNSISH